MGVIHSSVARALLDLIKLLLVDMLLVGPQNAVPSTKIC